MESSSHRTAGRPGWTAAAGSGAVLLAALAGCSAGHGSADAASSPAVSASGSPPGAGAVERQVADVYRRMRAEEVRAMRTGLLSGARVEDYAVGQAYASIGAEVGRDHLEGVAFVGTPTSTVRVVAVDLRQVPHRATVSECLDVTHWVPVAATTRVPLALPDQVKRYTVSGTLVARGSGWVVDGYTVERSRPC